MVRYVLKQMKSDGSPVYGKWFAYPVIEETINLDELADHMSKHNSSYSKGVIKGLLTDMITCIKELLLEGKNVKIDDLAIFSLGIKNSKGGANKEEEFSVNKNIDGVKFRARATGTLTPKVLNLEATLKKATALIGSLVVDSEDDPENPDDGDDTTDNTSQGGSTTNSSDSQSGSGTSTNTDPDSGGNGGSTGGEDEES